MPAAAQIGLDKTGITAEPCHFHREGGFAAFGGSKEMIPAIVSNAGSHAAGQRSARFVLNRLASSRVDAIDLFSRKAVGHPTAHIVPHAHGRIACQLIRPDFFGGSVGAKEWHLKIL